VLHGQLPSERVVVALLGVMKAGATYVPLDPAYPPDRQAFIVDDAGAVSVEGVPSRGRVKLQVKVGPGDLGRVIGRRGRTAQSIRTVVRAAATRDGVEVDVDFVDD